jgi:hypothetical protein
LCWAIGLRAVAASFRCYADRLSGKEIPMKRFHCFNLLLLAAALLGMTLPATAAGPQPVALNGSGSGTVLMVGSFAFSGSIAANSLGIVSFSGNSHVTGVDKKNPAISLVDGAITFVAGNGDQLQATVTGSSNAGAFSGTLTWDPKASTGQYSGAKGTDDVISVTMDTSMTTFDILSLTVSGKIKL